MWPPVRTSRSQCAAGRPGSSDSSTSSPQTFSNGTRPTSSSMSTPRYRSWPPSRSGSAISVSNATTPARPGLNSGVLIGESPPARSRGRRPAPRAAASTSAAAARSWTATPTDLYSVISVGRGAAGPVAGHELAELGVDRRRVEPLELGGAGRRRRERASRGSRRRSSPRGRCAGSSSKPPRAAKPTELTCVPGASQSSRTTGSGECVVAATTSAPRTASSNEARHVRRSRPRAPAPSRGRARRRGSRPSRGCPRTRARASAPARRCRGWRARVASSRASSRAASAAATGRPRLRDVRPVHERDRRPVRRVEEHDRRLVRRPVDVAGKERDELAAEPGRRQVRRHRAEQAGVAGPGGDARRHRRRARRQLRVRARERVEERVDVEQLLHLGSRQDEHREDVSRRRLSGVRGARPRVRAEPAAAAASSRRGPPPRAAPPSRPRSRRACCATAGRRPLGGPRGEPRRREEVVQRRPTASASATSDELHQQHVPVAGRPEVVDVREAAGC